MGKAVFVSYKYGDAQVRALPHVSGFTKARHYVDELDKLLEEGDNIYKGEDDGEDLSSLKDATIGSKLGDKIFGSSVTIVLISKGMKDRFALEKDQWIPWEISYSLKEQSRTGGRSKTNALLAVVLPDENNSYEHFIKENTCPHCNARTLMTNSLFQILSDNMFNIKEPTFSQCADHIGSKSYTGYSSYIYSVKWDDFAKAVNRYIDIAVNIQKNINAYEIVKTVK